MNALLVYPEIPLTFWSFKDALKFISKKAAEPPLGLITVAGMMPDEWNKKLIDMNVESLDDEQILWADYVFLSGMSIQMKSFNDVVKKCNRLGVKVVAGGPLCSTQYNEILGVDHFVLDEAEITFPQFLNDLQNGKPKYVYQTDEFPDIELAHVPRWDLLDKKKYAVMSIQYSRGCPYDCEFCSITVLNGRKPRTKSKEQFFNELNVLYNQGWRGMVSIVDDNFIGNKIKLKKEILPALIDWSVKRKYPFRFSSEVSINLSDDAVLVDQMVKAGFTTVFVGIETPNDASLIECAKSHNLKRNLISSVNKLQSRGLIVSAGFIVGFDNDPEDIFDRQINFIQKSGIVTAMVGLLNAPIGTKLFKRLKSENRLLQNFSGNNMDSSINFIPKMNYKELMKGYSKILSTIYSQKEFYNRMKKFLNDYSQPAWEKITPSVTQIKAFIKLILKLGFLEKDKRYFWKLFALSIFKYPKKFMVSMTLAVYGFHFRKVVALI
ncbi:MAG: DUF4070 domain-containing protein [Ignavibacteria bacterium]|jgi:radical SAM superfamily enzyme YgiQ (UPF0313 family)